jgi:hypothetical protein
MSKGKGIFLALIALGIGCVPGEAVAHQVYCYSEAVPQGNKLERNFAAPTLYITPVFASDASVDLLAALFGQAVSEGGLATCVTDEDQTDLAAAWQDFMNDSKAQGTTVVLKPIPTE